MTARRKRPSARLTTRQRKGVAALALRDEAMHNLRAKLLPKAISKDRRMWPGAFLDVLNTPGIPDGTTLSAVRQIAHVPDHAKWMVTAGKDVIDALALTVLTARGVVAIMLKHQTVRHPGAVAVVGNAVDAFRKIQRGMLDDDPYYRDLTTTQRAALDHVLEDGRAFLFHLLEIPPRWLRRLKRCANPKCAGRAGPYFWDSHVGLKRQFCEPACSPRQIARSAPRSR
jgi:hypothetical protein